MTIADVTAVVVAIVTSIYTVFSILLWQTTKKTLEVILSQTRIQMASTASSSQHSALDAHRDLYLGIISNNELIKIFAQEFQGSEDSVRRDFIATMLINHALRIYADIRIHSSEQEEIDSYNDDIRYLLSMPFVKKRWLQVRTSHPEPFQKYINKIILNQQLSNQDIIKPESNPMPSS